MLMKVVGCFLVVAVLCAAHDETVLDESLNFIQEQTQMGAKVSIQVNCRFNLVAEHALIHSIHMTGRYLLLV